MEWGDVTGSVAIAISLGAFVVSIKARQDSKRSVAAAERSAAADEAALLLGQREAEERRAVAEEAVRPKTQLVVEHVKDVYYQVRNAGNAMAEGITLAAMENLQAPENVTLLSGETFGIRLLPAWGHPLPSGLRATWHGQSEPVVLPVPPRD